MDAPCQTTHQRLCASFVSSFRGEKECTYTQTHAHTYTSAQSSRWPLISWTNQSRQSQQQLIGQMQDPERSGEVFLEFRSFSLLYLFHFLLNFGTSIFGIRVSVTVASGIQQTLWGRQSIWQMLCMRGVLIDENQFTVSTHIRDDKRFMSNSWHILNEELV